ncbi:hypothetical protein IJ095_00875 [Candidatus Saccharibacteria bacterium]|nr:hypothetical protein [Candidatus Saccharibacteria bacterium]
MKVSEKVKTFIMAGALALAGVGAAAVSTVTVAQTPVYADWKSEVQGGADSTGGNGTGQSLDDYVKTIINTILYIVGILAVVMVIFGGVQYTTSAGDQAKVTKAKNTILYGLIGLIVAVLAYAIVQFVIDKL